MLGLRYSDWVEELKTIVDDAEGLTLAEFCDVKQLPKWYGLGFSPLETYEEIVEENVD